jgi:hypothetical protein
MPKFSRAAIISSFYDHHFAAEESSPNAVRGLEEPLGTTNRMDECNGKGKDRDDASDRGHNDNHATKPVKSNAHLKGRRRFAADLADMEEKCKNTFSIPGCKMCLRGSWFIKEVLGLSFSFYTHAYRFSRWRG